MIVSGEYVTVEFDKGREMVDVTIYPEVGGPIQTVFDRERFEEIEASVGSDVELGRRVVAVYLDRSDPGFFKRFRSRVCRLIGW